MKKILLALFLLVIVSGTSSGYDVSHVSPYTTENCSCQNYSVIPNFLNGLNTYGPLYFTTSGLGFSYGTTAIVSNGGVSAYGGFITGQTMTVPTLIEGSVNPSNNYSLGFFANPLTTQTYSVPSILYNILDPAMAYQTFGNWYSYFLPGWNSTFTITWNNGTYSNIENMSGHFVMDDPNNLLQMPGQRLGGIKNFYVVPQLSDTNVTGSTTPLSYDFQYGGLLNVLYLSGYAPYFEQYIDPFNVMLNSGSSMTIASQHTMTIASEEPMNISSNNNLTNISGKLGVNIIVNSGAMNITASNGNGAININGTPINIASYNLVNISGSPINIASTGSVSVTASSGISLLSDTSLFKNVVLPNTRFIKYTPSSGLTYTTTNYMSYYVAAPPIQYTGIDSDGNIVSVDQSNLTKLDPNGNVIFSVFAGGGAMYLDILPNNHYVVVSYPTGNVSIYSQTGTLLTSTTFGSLSAFGVVYSGYSNTLYVGWLNVYAMNPTTAALEYTYTISAPNFDNGVNSMCVDKNGNVWAALLNSSSQDEQGTTVAEINPSTKAISYFSVGTIASGSYGTVEPVCLGNYVYVGMYHNNSITKLDLNGNFITNVVYGNVLGGNVATDSQEQYLYLNSPFTTSTYLKIDPNTMSVVSQVPNPLPSATPTGGIFVGVNNIFVALNTVSDFIYQAYLGGPSLIGYSPDNVNFEVYMPMFADTLLTNTLTATTFSASSGYINNVPIATSKTWTTVLASGCVTVTNALFPDTNYACAMSYDGTPSTVMGIPGFTYSTGSSFTACSYSAAAVLNTTDNNKVRITCTKVNPR